VEHQEQSDLVSDQELNQSESRSEPFLANRTNGRTYATVLHLLSSDVCDVIYCGYTLHPRAKVTIENL